MMDFIFVEDTARANLLAVKADRIDDVYNIASGKQTSLLELWHAIQEVSGAHYLTPVFRPAPRVNPVPRLLADISLAREDLGFTAEIPLQVGLARLADWRRSAQSMSSIGQRLHSALVGNTGKTY